MAQVPEPAATCRALLAALDAADGRRRSRKRDQTPDAIGLAVKRDLLEQACRAAPGAACFERWLMMRAAAGRDGADAGAATAMARAILDEWRLACAMPEFAAWLDDGAPSADADSPLRR